VWNVDDAKFAAEKAALEAMLKAYPDTSKWLKGINVGSESLYRKEITADKLAQQIYDVKGMVQIAYGASSVPVGTADTWNQWVDGANAGE
jgi:exo-beta-1,3-glucanase (GH17 family)